MKNLFLSLAFMLIGSFSFASSNCDVKETNLLIKSEEVEMNGRKVAIGFYEIDKNSLIELKKYCFLQTTP